MGSHLRLCSLNRNELGNAVKTKRQSFFDNENFCLYYILYVKLLQSFYSQLKGKNAKKNFHNAQSLQENLAAANY